MLTWIVLVAVVVQPLSIPVYTSNSCGSNNFLNASCSSSGSSVTIGVSETSGGGSGGGGGSGAGGGGGVSGPPVDPCPPETPLPRCAYLSPYLDYDDTEQDPEDPAPTAPPAVTVTDLASFHPDPATVTGQPLGFGVVGAETNVIATASTHTQHGTILSWPVAVTFTPVAYRIDFGDGTTIRTTSGGNSWETLGLPQGTATDTTHVYRQRGMYTITVVVEYAATVQFPDNSTQTVPGVVTSTAGSYSIEVLQARTVLVEHSCTEDPTSPGC